MVVHPLSRESREASLAVTTTAVVRNELSLSGQRYEKKCTPCLSIYGVNSGLIILEKTTG